MRSSAIPISDTTSRDQAVTLLRLGRIVNFMKFLVDCNKAECIRESTLDAGYAPAVGFDLIEAGKELLRLFLRDGIIRGIAPSGVIFEHRSSVELTSRFLTGLSKINMRGTKW